MSRYVGRINEPNSFILPWVWKIHYLVKGKPHVEDFCCQTDNIVFAAMIFEASKLPVKVTVAHMAICGYQKEFAELLNNEPQAPDGQWILKSW